MNAAANTAKNHCLLGDNAVVAWYEGLVQNGVLFADAKQSGAVAKLQALADAAVAPAGGFWSRLWTPPKPAGKCGLYLHGGVGRGKSFLMDGFYLQLRAENKMRAHFHQFMRRLHEDMKKRKGEADPLLAVADGISSRFGIVCLDEFHVSDIADAMILGRLIDRLTINGTRLAATSNYAPSELYPNGLARDRFLPAIAMLRERLELFALDGGEDYRLRHIDGKGGVFFCGDDGARMRKLFDALACGIALPPSIKINGRRLPAQARSSDAIWFSFPQLCGDALGQGDYLALAERFAVIMLSDVPPLNDPAMAEAARRFTWLVDIVYDRRATLALDLRTPLEKLYGGGDGGESGRTMSRLIEMQSRDYWGGALPFVSAASS